MLVLAGIGAISLTMPLTIAICVVLAIVATSYWQTIRAYPNGREQLPRRQRQPGLDRPGSWRAPRCSSTTR